LSTNSSNHPALSMAAPVQIIAISNPDGFIEPYKAPL
jgi:hypothetical protein